MANQVSSAGAQRQARLRGLLADRGADEIVERVAQRQDRTRRLGLRVTDREKALLDQLAAHCGVSVTRLVVGLAEIAAERLAHRSTKR